MMHTEELDSGDGCTLQSLSFGGKVVKEFKITLACLAEAKMGLNHETNSRDTLHSRKHSCTLRLTKLKKKLKMAHPILQRWKFAHLISE